MITPVPPIFRKRSRPARRGKTGAPPAPAALTLVQASLLPFGPPTVKLKFDRAIDVSGIAPAQITVQQPSGTGRAYAGSAVASMPDAQTVNISLADTGAASGTQNRVSATASTGIVASDDGGTWAGVANLALPFP